MGDIGSALQAVGQAAKLAGDLGGKAFELAQRVNMSGVKNAAVKAYETAKNLTKNVNIGKLGTKALNAARSFKNIASRSINPQKIANSASNAARLIGQAAQGAGSTMAQVGATLKNRLNLGKAAQVAAQLRDKATNLVKGIHVPGGIKNAAASAFETAKRLKNSVPIGAIGTKALNAARSFKNTVARSVNPQTIANSASKAASFIGQAAQGAGSKMTQLASTLKKSFNDHGGWTGFGQRALAPTNVGNQRNPFRVPVPAWQAAATGQMPQRSIFMPAAATPSTGSWWGGAVKKRGSKTFRKKSRKGTRRR
jgi:hypothetical protein